MTYPMTFNGVFTKKPIILKSRAELEDVLYRARNAELKSLDHVPLRNSALSDNKGMLKMRVVIDHGLKEPWFAYDDDDAEVLYGHMKRVFSYCNIDGVRGQRAYIIPDIQTIRDMVEDDDEIEFDAWIAPNVWYNEHRVTSGYPATPDEKEDVLRDIKDRLERNADVEMDIAFVETPTNIALTLHRIAEQAQALMDTGHNEEVIRYLRDRVASVQKTLEQS